MTCNTAPACFNCGTGSTFRVDTLQLALFYRVLTSKTKGYLRCFSFLSLHIFSLCLFRCYTVTWSMDNGESRLTGLSSNNRWNVAVHVSLYIYIYLVHTRRNNSYAYFLLVRYFRFNLCDVGTYPNQTPMFSVRLPPFTRTPQDPNITLN